MSDHPTPDHPTSDHPGHDALPDVPIDEAALRRAFAVTDELNVHDARCVCPRCAGRLTGLLSELADAIDLLGRPVP